jgi:hypothetical protein
MNHLKILPGLGFFLILIHLVFTKNYTDSHPQEIQKNTLTGKVYFHNTIGPACSKTFGIYIRGLTFSGIQSNPDAAQVSDTIRSPFVNRVSHVLDFRRLRSWILIFVFTIVLVFVKINFGFIDNLLSGMYRNPKMLKKEAAKINILKTSRKNIPRRLINLLKTHWYPFLSGGITGAVLFIGTIWDESGTNWFFSQGIKIFTLSYDHSVCFFLSAGCIIVLFITLSWMISSFAIYGPVGGLFRIFLLLLINSMLMMVAYFLLIPVTLYILGLLIYRRINHKTGFLSSGQE